MAKVKFYKGVEANLPTSGMVEDGAFYMCTDTGNMYLGSGTTTLIQLNQSPYYGSCATAAGEQTKVVTLNNASNFVLRIGTTIYVKFSNTNTYSATAAAPTKLDVANTGAKQIYGANTATPTGTSTTYFGRANYVNCYVYDGTYWVWNGSSQDNDGNNNVTQTATTTNANYEVLFSQTADNTTRTEQARKNSNLKFNPSTGDLQTTKLNGVTIGSSPKFTDTTYESKAAASGGTDESLVTTGEKYTWNGKLDKSGGTMTGALTLSGAPTADLHAATKKYVDDSILALPEPMIFKGSLGTGGTITSLPTASASNEGFTYKVITAGTYASQAAKVGDTFISDGSTWVLIPSGDEPSGTVTSVKITATSPIVIDSDAAITTSGTRALSHANSGATAGSYGDSAAQTPAYGATFKVPYVTVNATGHVTAISEHTVKIPASDNTNTHRPIQVNGTQILGDNTTALNLKAGTNVSLTNSSGTVTIAATDTTYSAGTGLSLSGTTINHSNSVTAGTAGTSSATSGSTLSVPYVTYDAQGHVTASGTHIHTVDGFLPSSGGTITGDLTRKDTRIDASKADNNVTTTIYPTTFNVTDVSNRIITRKEAIVQSNGNISAFWYCRNYDTSGTMVAQKGIQITVNKAGTATYAVSDGANFRSAIGAGTGNGTVTSIATSGTGISGGTITTSGTITLDSSAEGNRAANKVVIAKAAGQINSEKWATTSSGTVKATMQYNSTDDSLDFIFA